MLEELVKHVESGTIRLIDVLILAKDDDGAIEAIELSDLADLGPLETLEAELAEFLGQEDVQHLAAAMNPAASPGCSCTRLWAAPFASAARRSGGQPSRTDASLPSHRGRIEADAALETAGG